VASGSWTLRGKAKLKRRLAELMGDTAGFNGYAIVTGSQPFYAMALTGADPDVAIASGQAVKPAGTAASRLFAAHFETGPNSTGSLLTLVNPGKRTMRVTVTAVDANGLNLAPAVNLSIEAGGQLRADAGRLLGLASDVVNAGSLIIESDIPGLLGDLRFGERGKAIVALDGSPSVYAVLMPTAGGPLSFTGLSAMNTSQRVAAVTIRTYGGEGRLMSQTRLSLPGLGRFSDLLDRLAAGNAGGYVTLEADQPISTAGVWGRASLDWLAAMPARQFPSVQGTNAPPTSAPQVARSNTMTGIAGVTKVPAVDVSPASIAFGNVPVGQTRESSVSVRNTGTAALIVQWLSATNPTYTFTGPQMPFAIAAGGQQTIGVRFTPSVAATLAAEMAIGTNDPARPTARIALSGTGTRETIPVPPPAANGIPLLSSVTPTTVIAGGPAFTLTVNGGNFVSGSQIEWNGVGLPTMFPGSIQLTATIPASMIARPGDVDITVFTPPPGGGRTFTTARIRVVAADAPGTGPTLSIQQFDLGTCPEVHFFVSALDRNQNPLDRLNGTQLSCGEDNVIERCSIDPISTTGIPLAVAFVIGTNGFPVADQVEPVKQAVQAFVDELAPGDFGTVIQAENSARSVQNWTDGKEGIKSAIGTLHESGPGTALYDSINTALTVMGSMRGKRQAIVVVTPSGNTSGSTLAETVTAAAAARGVAIYSLATGPAVANDGLFAFFKQLAVNSGGVALRGGQSELRPAMYRFVNILRSQYQMVYFSSHADGRPHSAFVNLQGNFGSATTSRTYPGCR
jgi:hypothetical protein